MLTPSVDRIFLKRIYCGDQELARFCVELSHLYVPKFTPFSFKAGFSLHSDFRHVKILPYNMAQFVLGKLVSSKQISPSQNGMKVCWLKVACRSWKLYTGTIVNRRPPLGSVYFSGWKLWLSIWVCVSVTRFWIASLCSMVKTLDLSTFFPKIVWPLLLMAFFVQHTRGCFSQTSANRYHWEAFKIWVSFCKINVYLWRHAYLIDTYVHESLTDEILGCGLLD